MKNLWAYLLLLAIVVLPLTIAEFYGCAVSGQEFSPDDFTARTFSYRRSPFSGALRSDRQIKDYELPCTAVTDDGHITAINATPSFTRKRWDLFREDMQYSDKLSHEFDARFLTHFLNYNSQQWTISYPEKASILWPEVASMARNGLYLYIPEIMLSAIPEEYENEGSRTLEAFKNEIQTEFANAYRLAAKVAKASGDSKEAQWLEAAKRCQRGDLAESNTEAED